MTTHHKHSRGSTIRSATPVRLPVSHKRPDLLTMRDDRPEPAKHHRIAVGDEFAVMVWERRTYEVVRVTYYRRGESVNVRATFDGTTYSLPESALHFGAAQAMHHIGWAPDAPQVGIIARADGTAHHLTSAGECVECNHA